MHKCEFERKMVTTVRMGCTDQYIRNREWYNSTNTATTLESNNNITSRLNHSLKRKKAHNYCTLSSSKLPIFFPAKALCSLRTNPARILLNVNPSGQTTKPTQWPNVFSLKPHRHHPFLLLLSTRAALFLTIYIYVKW